VNVRRIAGGVLGALLVVLLLPVLIIIGPGILVVLASQAWERRKMTPFQRAVWQMPCFDMDEGWYDELEETRDEAREALKQLDGLPMTDASFESLARQELRLALEAVVTDPTIEGIGHWRMLRRAVLEPEKHGTYLAARRPLSEPPQQA
jgi:hypothetical protein